MRAVVLVSLPCSGLLSGDGCLGGEAWGSWGQCSEGYNLVTKHGSGGAQGSSRG